MNSDQQFDAADLDPGIRLVVQWLRAHGYRTVDSGDGRTKIARGLDPVLDGILEFPHVAIRVKPTMIITQSHNLHRLATSVLGVPDFDSEAHWNIEASYNPADGIALLMLQHVDSAMLEKNGVKL